ncbi:hypothetical protein PybrP1_010473 [[Pythium] brassicae (nom. inval.)]|nr:hypothetical protein PybrP1_010473 [[Pythium] brassicae (nom. inval.)]
MLREGVRRRRDDQRRGGAPAPSQERRPVSEAGVSPHDDHVPPRTPKAREPGQRAHRQRPDFEQPLLRQRRRGSVTTRAREQVPTSEGPVRPLRVAPATRHSGHNARRLRELWYAGVVAGDPARMVQV